MVKSKKENGAQLTTLNTGDSACNFVISRTKRLVTSTVCHFYLIRDYTYFIKLYVSYLPLLTLATKFMT